LNVHGVNDVRQKEIYTAKPLAPEPSAFEFVLAKSHKSPSTDQPPAESIKAGVEQFAMRSINLLFLFGIRRNCLRSGMSRTLYLSTRGAIKQIVVIRGHITFANYVQNFIQHPAVKVNSICSGNYWISSAWISTQKYSTDHIFCISEILEKKWEYNEAVHRLLIDFKEAYDSIRRERFYLHCFSTLL